MKVSVCSFLLCHNCHNKNKAEEKFGKERIEKNKDRVQRKNRNNKKVPKNPKFAAWRNFEPFVSQVQEELKDHLRIGKVATAQSSLNIPIPSLIFSPTQRLIPT